jgi:hypothetical protein
LNETVFFYDPFVFFEGTFNPVHVIAVSIGHRGYDPVIAMSLGAKAHVRNPSHHFTNAELAHRLVPQFNDLWHPTLSSLLQTPGTPFTGSKATVASRIRKSDADRSTRRAGAVASSARSQRQQWTRKSPGVMSRRG